MEFNMLKMSRNQRAKRGPDLQLDIVDVLPAGRASKITKRGAEITASKSWKSLRTIESSRIQEDFWLRVRCGLRI